MLYVSRWCVVVLFLFFFFFFKQKTAYEMRISDWSSNVCSSDLVTATGAAAALAGSAAEAILPPGAIAHCAKGMTAQVAASVLNHFFTGKPLVMGLCGRWKEKGKGKSERAVSGTSATSTPRHSRSATGRKAASDRKRTRLNSSH